MKKYILLVAIALILAMIPEWIVFAAATIVGVCAIIQAIASDLTEIYQNDERGSI